MTKLYRDIISRSWKMLWQHPWLWIFGLFAVFASGTGEYASLLTSFNKIARNTDIIVGLKQSIYSNELNVFWSSLQQFFHQPTVITVILLSAAVAITLLVAWIITISQIGLVKAAGSLGMGESADFATSFKAGNKHFWTVLWLNILLKFLVYLLLIVATLPFLISYLSRANEDWGFNSLFFITFIIFLPLTLIIFFIIKYAIAYVVLRKNTWWQALENSISLFLRNWLVSLEMSAVLFVIYLALGMIVYILLPQTFLLILSDLFKGVDLLVLARLMPWLLLILFVGAGYGAFQYLAWVLLFERLDVGTAAPKLVRLTSEVPTYIERWFATPTKAKKSK